MGWDGMGGDVQYMYKEWKIWGWSHYSVGVRVRGM